MVNEENIPVKFFFQVKLVSKTYRRNNQIEVVSSRNERLQFDFLIWSGLPSDFAKVATPNLLNYHDQKIFAASTHQHAAVSMVDLKDDLDKGGLANLYVKNWDVLSFSNNVVLDFDAYGVSKVSFNLEFSM